VSLAFPDLAERRAEWSRQGGKNSSSKARARKAMPDAGMSAAELRSFMPLIMKGVVAGRFSVGVGNCVANLGKAIDDVARSADLEQQIADLRARIEGRTA
jgi:hypothetical protein